MSKVVLVANTDWYLFRFRLALAQFLHAEGFEVLLVSPPGKFAFNLQEAGFRWQPWILGRQTMAPWKELGALLRLSQFYRHHQPDLVHHFTIKPVIYGSIAARLARIPAVVNAVTGLGYVFHSTETRAKLLRPVAKVFYRLAFHHRASAAIFENDADRQYFLQKGLVNTARAFLIEGVGVDPDYFTPNPEPPGVPVIVLPARMLWDKGVGEMVEAVRLLHQKNQVRVALVGEPDPGNPASIDENVLQEWQSEGLVEWWGWRQDMRSVYAQSHIVTLPSYGEGVPTVLLEAAASGRPIVTTDTPGCREVVRDGLNGLIVPPKDATALADALNRLITDARLRVRMGTAGRQLVLERFTNSHVNTATLAVYRSLTVGLSDDSSRESD